MPWSLRSNADSKVALLFKDRWGVEAVRAEQSAQGWRTGPRCKLDTLSWISEPCQHSFKGCLSLKLERSWSCAYIAVFRECHGSSEDDGLSGRMLCRDGEPELRCQVLLRALDNIKMRTLQSWATPTSTLLLHILQGLICHGQGLITQAKVFTITPPLFSTTV